MRHRSLRLGCVWLMLLLAAPAHASMFGDLNCDDGVDIIDVQLTILVALGVPLSSSLDGDQDGTPDACPSPLTCGVGTVVDAAGGGCIAVITQSDLDSAVANATAGLFTQSELDAAVANATAGLFTQSELDAAVANATAGLFTQSELDAAVANATAGLFTQSELDAAAANATAGLFTQSELDAAVANATAGLFTQSELDAAVANATAGLFTQSELDAAVANATAGLFTQSELDAAVANATNNCPSQETILGCTNAQACNYAPNSNSDDGSCVLPTAGFDCLGNALPTVGDTAFGGMVISVDEAAGTGLVIAMEDAAPGNWNEAIMNANDFVSNVEGGYEACNVGYLSPWRLPTQQEFMTICALGDLPNHVWEEQASYLAGIDGWSGWYFWTSDVDPWQATASHYGTYYEPGESPYGPDGSCKVSSSTNNNFQQSTVIRVRPFRTYSIY